MVVKRLVNPRDWLRVCQVLRQTLLDPRDWLITILCVQMALLQPMLIAETDDKSSSTESTDEDEGKTVKAREQSLTLAVGVSRTLEFSFDIGPINLTDSSLIDFSRIRENNAERKLYILPKKAGYTDMTIHDTNGKPRVTYLLNVTREDMGRIMSQLEELLGDIEGIKIKSVGGTIILDGELILPKDLIRINRVLNALKDRDPKSKETPIKNLVSLSKITMNILAERIEREIGSPEIQVRVINNTLFLEGTAENSFEADRALDLARTYLPEAIIEQPQGDGISLRAKATGGYGGGVPTVVDLLRVRPPQPPAPQQDIEITMNYVELKNDYDKSFTFNWRPLMADTSNVKYDSSAGELSANFIATITSLLPKLHRLTSHGHARILKSESIVVKDRSETPAAIESSVDVYTRVTNEKGESAMQAIPVQNFTKVKAAIVPGTDTIDMGIQISINSLIGNAGGTPQIAKNSIQTQVTIKNGESAALGGHAIDEAVAGYNRDQPSATGGASPLFNMQRSKQFSRLKQQYIIFVTPRILRNANAATEDMSRKFRMTAGER